MNMIEPTQAEIDGVANVLEQAADDSIARSSAYIMAKMLKRVFVGDRLSFERGAEIAEEVGQANPSSGSRSRAD